MATANKLKNKKKSSKKSSKTQVQNTDEKAIARLLNKQPDELTKLLKKYPQGSVALLTAASKSNEETAQEDATRIINTQAYHSDSEMDEDPNNDNTDFSCPPKRRCGRASPAKQLVVVQTSNKYTALASQAAIDPIPAVNDHGMTPHVPPVIIHNKERWNSISAELKNKNIKFKKAINTHDGIKVHPTTPDDHRRYRWQWF